MFADLIKPYISMLMTPLQKTENSLTKLKAKSYINLKLEKIQSQNSFTQTQIQRVQIHFVLQ